MATNKDDTRKGKERLNFMSLPFSKFDVAISYGLKQASDFPIHFFVSAKMSWAIVHIASKPKRCHANEPHQIHRDH
jgi:hypothetical protein